MTVAQAAAASGVTVRTLRYYDRVGLLRPDQVSPAGYRLYGEGAMDRLKQILFFREAGFQLKQIIRIMAAPGYDRRAALEAQLRLLGARRQRLDRVMDLLRRTLDGEETGFDAFNIKEEQKMRDAYAQEAFERWGHTPAYDQSERRRPGGADTAMAQCFAAFEACRDQGAHSQSARAAVAGLRAHIEKNYYDVSDEIMLGLAQMYEEDPRFTRTIDGWGTPGLAAFAAQAIRVAVGETPR